MARKLTVNITDQTDAALEALNGSDVTTTAAVNRAVRLYAWLQSEIDAGSQVQVVAADGRVTAVKLF